MSGPVAATAARTVSALPARSLDEAYEYLTMRPCACGALTDPITDLSVTEDGGTHRLGFTCGECARLREYAVVLTERLNQPGEEFAYARSGRRSQLIDGGGWAVVLHKYYAASVDLMDELDGQAPSDVLAAILARYLTRAAAAADEALALLPDGAQEMPESEVSTEAGRLWRGRHPDLFSRRMLETGPRRCRERLTELMAAYQDDRHCLGTRLEALAGEVLPYGTRHLGEPFPARTYWEALFHSRTIDCRCGGNGIDPARTSLEIEGQTLTRLFGACGQCGRPREFLYRNLDDPHEPLRLDVAWAVDQRPSQLLDPGVFASLAGVCGGIAETQIGWLARENATGQYDPAGRWHSIQHHFWLADAAAEEALRMIPPGADAIAPQSLWHPLGRAQLAEHPETLRRDDLQRQREAIRRAQAEFFARYPQPEDPDDDGEPLRPRSVAERAIYLALHPCACGEVVFEPDDLVVRDEGGESIGCERGACPGCGRVRRFAFVTWHWPHRHDPAVGWSDLRRCSEIIDAGQWLRVSDDCQDVAGQLEAGGEAGREQAVLSVLAGAGPEQARRTLLAWSASAVDEALLFLPEGAGELPGYAFWTEDGRRARQARPERFTRAALTVLREERWSRVRPPGGS